VDGRIALEEHFTTSALEDCIVVGRDPATRREMLDRLEDLDRRLEEMDQLGIELSVLSFGSDGIQGVLDPQLAVVRAREANDALAQLVAQRPARFAGFAALPMQDPDAAAEELERAVTELGFHGALVNGYSNLGDEGTGVYYDGLEYLPFWERVDSLGVPFYLHPRNPLPSQRRIYEGRPELLGSTWAFGVETATHALRLITSGLFDRLPSLGIILGHLGENLPFAIARLEERLAHVQGVKLQRGPRQVLRENFHVTTSGNYHTPSLVGILLELGADRVMFSADYPFAEMRDAVEWFDALPISESDRLKIGRTNALKLLDLE
jgi:gamma-resorcylate decarboxylase